MAYAHVPLGRAVMADGVLATDAVLSAFRPVDRAEGAAEIGERLIAPLCASFPDLEERLDIRLSGRFADAEWTASSGHLAGTFARPLFGIPATGFPAFIRFGRFDRWDSDGRIAEMILLLDLPELMMQAGVWPLAAPLGRRLVAPGPVTHDGVGDGAAVDPAESAKSLALVEAMIAGLMRYDRQSLASMRMVDFWTPDFWWFGPAPIGTMRGHADYERGHQGPFLTAFPDRVGGNHRCRIGERSYVASTGWPSIRATHSGGGWLGLPPTNRAVTMRVMDFWRRDGDRLAENWVMIDIPDLLAQLDLDVFARMAALAPAAPRA